MQQAVLNQTGRKHPHGASSLSYGEPVSNRHALEAVLEDIEKQRPDWVYCLGDLVGYGAFPNEVIELIRDRGIPTIVGNYDDGVGFDKNDHPPRPTRPCARTRFLGQPCLVGRLSLAATVAGHMSSQPICEASGRFILSSFAGCYRLQLVSHLQRVSCEQASVGL